MTTYELIEKRRTHLLAQLKQQTEEHLHLPEGEGKWSVIQVLNHLITAERGSLMYCQKKLLAGDALEEATRIAKLKMTFFNWLVQFPIKLKAPAAISNPSNQESLKEVIALWDKSREKLSVFIADLPDNYRSKSIYKHPYAGRIDLEGMLHFFASHQRHHEIQIRRILKSTSK